MIRLLSPADAPCCPEPLIGCKIDTLTSCYHTLGADRYQNELGGVLCRFGTSLLLSGRCDPGELAEFCAMLGVTRIEGRSDCLAPPNGWQLTEAPILTRSPAASEIKGERIPTASSERLRRVFALLCESDARFADEAEYLPWLSDLTRRRNDGRAEIYLIDDTATACLAAISGGYAWLSSLAVAPSVRGNGLGRRILNLLVADCAARGLTLATAAQNFGLIPFYEQAGFVQDDCNLLIATAPT